MDWEKDCQNKFWKNFLIPLGLETCKATRRQADKARRINALAYELLAYELLSSNLQHAEARKKPASLIFLAKASRLHASY